MRQQVMTNAAARCSRGEWRTAWSDVFDCSTEMNRSLHTGRPARSMTSGNSPGRGDRRSQNKVTIKGPAWCCPRDGQPCMVQINTNIFVECSIHAYISSRDSSQTRHQLSTRHARNNNDFSDVSISYDFRDSMSMIIKMGAHRPQALYIYIYMYIYIYIYISVMGNYKFLM